MLYSLSFRINIWNFCLKIYLYRCYIYIYFFEVIFISENMETYVFKHYIWIFNILTIWLWKVTNLMVNFLSLDNWSLPLMHVSSSTKTFFFISHHKLIYSPFFVKQLLRHYSKQFQFANTITNAVSLFFLTHSVVEATNHACVANFLMLSFSLKSWKKKELCFADFIFIPEPRFWSGN